MPWIDYRELRQRLDMDEVLAWMQWQATECRGDILRGSCPFCSVDQSGPGREFVAHRRRKLYYCFRCQQGGDILALWSRYHKLDLNTAANDLRKRLCYSPNAKSSNPQSPSLRPPI